MASTFTPLGNPPLGVTPNFDNPTDTLFPEIVATVVLSVLLTTGFTAARLVAKRAMTDFTIEDCKWIFLSIDTTSTDTHVLIQTFQLQHGLCSWGTLQPSCSKASQVLAAISGTSALNKPPEYRRYAPQHLIMYVLD